ncbi:MAG: hypothetical protein IJG60_07465 [Thermoguttaceae bacterium]|nr:hypothetical protein [Thermoguttaceae bacterium]
MKCLTVAFAAAASIGKFAVFPQTAKWTKTVSIALRFSDRYRTDVLSLMTNDSQATMSMTKFRSGPNRKRLPKFLAIAAVAAKEKISVPDCPMGMGAILF